MSMFYNTSLVAPGTAAGVGAEMTPGMSYPLGPPISLADASADVDRTKEVRSQMARQQQQQQQQHADDAADDAASIHSLATSVETNTIDLSRDNGLTPKRLPCFWCKATGKEIGMENFAEKGGLGTNEWHPLCSDCTIRHYRAADIRRRKDNMICTSKRVVSTPKKKAVDPSARVLGNFKISNKSGIKSRICRSSRHS
mmetsp:Transcript_28176/g.57182  ORF Transcript_28176/g.57182 Transcript_28176/m.57182 type:complete len:198 (-) Transcript_28176:60-653(-)